MSKKGAGCRCREPSAAVGEPGAAVGGRNKVGEVLVLPHRLSDVERRRKLTIPSVGSGGLGLYQQPRRPHYVEIMSYRSFRQAPPLTKLTKSPHKAI